MKRLMSNIFRNECNTNVKCNGEECAITSGNIMLITQNLLLSNLTNGFHVEDRLIRSDETNEELP